MSIRTHIMGLLLFMANLLSCQSLPKIPAQGQFLGVGIRSTVDSEYARFYLEDYLQAKKIDHPLYREIDGIHRSQGERLPNREQLQQLSQTYSVDFASLLFADALARVPCNRSLNLRFVEAQRSDAQPTANPSQYLILFVPGWDYAANGHVTGADLRQPRRLATRFGIENHLVELPPTGSVEENAQVVAQAIARHGETNKTILIAGASSAGPAIHLALGELVDETTAKQVKAWLNLGGILQGSPLVDHLQQWPQRWLLKVVAWVKGWEQAAIFSMGTERSRERFARLRLRNPELRVINYVGIPLSGTLSRFSQDKYPILKTHGPNDGLTLVSDVIAPDSETIVSLGTDHFFAEDPDIDRKTVALMKVVIDAVEDSGVPARNAAPESPKNEGCDVLGNRSACLPFTTICR